MQASEERQRSAREDPGRPPTLWSRRDLLTRSGWVLVLGSAGAAVVGALRVLFPRVSFAPPATVTLGDPEAFAIGQVVERWKQSHQLVLVREPAGFYALRAVCTHLGCIPNWSANQQVFHCPCHGSSFERDGANIDGPAPRPLERYAIHLNEAGQIVVNTAIRLRSERGEWDREDAYLKYPAGKGDDVT